MTPLTQTRPAAVRLTGATKTYGRGRNAVPALRGVDVEFQSGSFTAVMGPSGSGKSTLLHLAAGLDVASEGSVMLGDTSLVGLSEKRLTALRRDRVGFIFQAYNLVPTLTVEQNIGLPNRLRGRRTDAHHLREVAERIGLGALLKRKPSELSGGQQQRVAIARALVSSPEVLFADEPTGALDSRTSADILGLLQETTERYGLTIVMVTHDPVAAAWADAVLFLADGRLVGRLEFPTADEVAARMTHLEG